MTPTDRKEIAELFVLIARAILAQYEPMTAKALAGEIQERAREFGEREEG